MAPRRTGPVSARRSRVARRLLLWVASTLVVAAVPVGVVGAIVGGHLNVPWHLPAAAALNLYPVVTGAIALLLWAARTCAPRLAGAVDSALPCHRARAFRAHAFSSRLLATADVADNILWGAAAGAWAASLAGPALVAAYASYLSDANRYAFGALSASVGALLARALVARLNASGLYAEDDAVAASKKSDAAATRPMLLASAPAVSGLAQLQGIFAPCAAAGAVLLALFYSVGGGVHVASFWRLLAGG
jgi:hypothetical protein